MNQVHYYFSKHHIILTEAHCSYFFSGFQAHLFLFCSCNNCQLATMGKRLEDRDPNFWCESTKFPRVPDRAEDTDGVELVLL